MEFPGYLVQQICVFNIETRKSYGHLFDEGVTLIGYKTNLC